MLKIIEAIKYLNQSTRIRTQLIVSEMYVRVRLLMGSDSETHYINCRSINESMDELRDKVARKWKCDNASMVRLFFDGKEVIVSRCQRSQRKFAAIFQNIFQKVFSDS